MYRFIAVMLSCAYGMHMCKNCVHFKAPPNLPHHTDYNSAWSKCQRFNDYADYCRKEDGLCGKSAKFFIHKDYSDSLIDIYTEFLHLISKEKEKEEEIK